MAIEKKHILKTYFQTGDIPTSAQYGDVIDSFVALTGSFPHDVANEGNITISGSIFIKGEVAHITASGNVSASGTGSFGHVISTFYEGNGSALTGLPTTTASMFPYTASMLAFSASIKLQTASLLTHTASVVGDLTSIKLVTSSLQAEVIKIKQTTASLEASDIAIKQQSQSLLLYTASNNADIASIKTKTGSLQAEVDALKAQTHSLLALTSSDNALVSQLNVQSASLISSDAAIKLQTASLLTHTASTKALVASFKLETSSLHTFTGSVNASITSIHAQTASLLTKTASLQTAISSIYSQTASILAQTASLLVFTSSLNATFAALNLQTASLLTFTASGYTTGSSYTASGLISAQTMSIANGATPSGVQLSIMGNASASGTITASGILIQGQSLGDSFFQVNDTIGAITLATTQSFNHDTTIPGGYNAINLTDNSGDITIELGKTLTNSGSLRLPYLLDAHNGSASMNGVLHVIGGQVKAKSGSFEYLDITDFTHLTSSIISASNTISALTASFGTSPSNTTNPAGTPLYIQGNVSASGNIYANKIYSNLAYYAGGYGVLGVSGDVTTVAKTGLKTHIDGTNIELDGPVTASGDISSSGGISASGLEVVGSAEITNHFSVGGTSSFSGNVTMKKALFISPVTFSADVSGTHDITARNIYSDQIIKGHTIQATNFISSSGDLFINQDTVLGSTVNNTHTFIGHITASGGISASGNIRGNNFVASTSLFAPSVTASSATGSFTGSFLGTFTSALTTALLVQSQSLLAYTASNDAEIAALKTITASLIAEDTSLKTITASLIAEDTSLKTYTSSNDLDIAALYAQTASLLAFSASGYQALLSASIGTPLSPTTNPSGIQLYVHGNISASGFVSSSTIDTNNIYAGGYVSASNIGAAIGTITNVTSSNVSASGYVSSSNIGAAIGTITNVTSSNVSASGFVSSSDVRATGNINSDRFIGANSFGSPTTIVTSTTIPAGYNVMLFTSNYNPSIIVNIGKNYTISAGADVRIINMSNVGNIPQTFYGEQ